MLINYDPINIIAISYFRPNDFRACINSLLYNTTLPYKLTIIDNSYGALNDELQQFESQNINIIKNNTNLGKAGSLKKWYKHITQDNKNRYFVSLDADVIVPKDWLEGLYRSLTETKMVLGALAPVLNEGKTFTEQIDDKCLTMHGGSDGFKAMRKISENVYHSHITAGPMLLMEREFYEQIGGYPGDRIYGNDDCYICRESKRLNRFIGFTALVECVHSRIDETEEYRQWKIENISKAGIRNGYWDRENNSDNTSV